MTELLTTLEREVDLLLDSGSSNLTQLANSTDIFLQDLRQLEAELEVECQEQITKAPSLDSLISSNGLENIENGSQLSTLALNEKNHSFEKLNKQFGNWYTNGIQGLKNYNGQITKFQKNVVNNSKFKVDLDDAYAFPLDLNSAPTREDMEAVSGTTLRNATEVPKLQNRRNLMKTISVHFLKMGYGSCVDELLKSLNLENLVKQATIDQFTELGHIVEDIKVRHDLTKALEWIAGEKRNRSPSFIELLFRLEMLQFVNLIQGRARQGPDSSEMTINDALVGLKYALKNFPKYFNRYADEIYPLMTLLLFKQPEESMSEKTLQEFMYKAFIKEIKDGGPKDYQKQFVAEILRCFSDIHSNQRLFDVMANKLTAVFCADMGLSNNSSLFEALLSGFVNLPNFYKYSRLQLKMNKQRPKEPITEETDMPFQLPDKNRFLFNYHPIFICPVSKEQLMPLTFEEEPPKKKSLLYGQSNGSDKNPVVVFQHCRHLALRESVKSLLRGSEKFKCHYCYKKHRILEVKDAYFIDL